MALNLIFHISDFHNLKIVDNIFFFIFKGGLIFLSRGVCVCIYIYINQPIGIVGRVFLTMVLDAFLLNTEHYNV